MQIAQARSFRRAAAQLNLTPSTLSHSLRALEARLGVQFIARTTRTLAVTPAGAALLEALTPALQGLDAAVEGVNAFRPRPHGMVRLALHRSAATMILAPRLGRRLCVERENWTREPNRWAVPPFPAKAG